MELKEEHGVSIRALNGGTHGGGFLNIRSGYGTFSVTLSLCPDELEDLAEELQKVARVCRREEDDKLNRRLEEMDKLQKA